MMMTALSLLVGGGMFLGCSGSEAPPDSAEASPDSAEAIVAEQEAMAREHPLPAEIRALALKGGDEIRIRAARVEVVANDKVRITVVTDPATAPDDLVCFLRAISKGGNFENLMKLTALKLEHFRGLGPSSTEWSRTEMFTSFDRLPSAQPGTVVFEGTFDFPWQDLGLDQYVMVVLSQGLPQPKPLVSNLFWTRVKNPAGY